VQKKKHDNFAQEQERVRKTQVEKTERLRALRLAKEVSDVVESAK
jgi:hypothetical protein